MPRQRTSPPADLPSGPYLYIAEPLRHLAVPIRDLTLDPGNTRLHDEANLAVIQSSLARFGQDQPVVVQTQGSVVRKGNGRVLAATRLGWTHIAAVFVDEGDVAAVARSIADNRAAELGRWDVPLLIQSLDRLEQADPRMAEVTGWSRAALDALRMAPLPDAVPSSDATPGMPADPDAPPADAPPAEPNPLDSVRDTQQINATYHEPTVAVAFGEVWKAGPHRVVVADPMFDVARWRQYLDDAVPFLPYAGPLALATQMADRAPVLIVQPDTYIVGHMLEFYAATHPGMEVAREQA